jgi:DNA-binding MurR/RpiR family transcriptional regulator
LEGGGAVEGGLVRLRESLGQLTPSELKVANYILLHPDEVVSFSVAELALHSGGSQAAVIRLCKSIGLDGYHDLKLKVAGDLVEQRWTEAYNELRPNDSIDSIIPNVSNKNIQSIRDTLKLLDPKTVREAVQAINRARRVDFYGIGSSALIAQDAQQKFMRINKLSSAYADAHLQMTSANSLNAQDTAVGISYSGATKEVVESVRKAKERGAFTIAITKYGSSDLQEEADITLHIAVNEGEIRLGALGSRIAQLTVIDILYLGVVSLNYEESLYYLKESSEAVRRVFKQPKGT